MLSSAVLQMGQAELAVSPLLTLCTFVRIFLWKTLHMKVFNLGGQLNFQMARQ
ncbi:hypothetical protein RchiOBHm_Chr1g0342621 [Rosa chinensis]|uniref:Uncharacterized protein n=1 Tax=Rosa chinensis TaxID=74649 RepID=A0A2P6SE24_ROSCH|nr:hypothetical protein RchiOBHm_Chr1g0342621 [Rosa chinensis]